MRKNGSSIIILCISLLLLLIVDVVGQRSSRMTIEEAMKKIADAYFEKAQEVEINRRIAYSIEDWPSSAGNFVKIEKNGLPILGSPSLHSDPLKINGVTEHGEILKYIDSTKIVEFTNPLSSAPDNSGQWIKVRTLEGDEGWIFSKPDGSVTSYVSFIKREITTPQQQKRPPAREISKEEDLKYLKTGLIILVVIVLFILIVKRDWSGKSSRTHPINSSSDYPYGSSSSSELKKQEEEKSKWPFREKDMIVGKKNIIEKHLIFPDEKVGKVEKNWKGDTEIHKEKIFGSEKVADVKRNFWGTAKSIETKDGGSFEIKETFWGRKIIVDEDGNEIGEYKGD